MGWRETVILLIWEIWTIGLNKTFENFDAKSIYERAIILLDSVLIGSYETISRWIHCYGRSKVIT